MCILFSLTRLEKSKRRSMKQEARCCSTTALTTWKHYCFIYLSVYLFFIYLKYSWITILVSRIQHNDSVCLYRVQAGAFLASCSFWGLPCCLASLCWWEPFSCPCSRPHLTFSLCVSSPDLFTRTHPAPAWPHLPLMASEKTYFQRRSQPQTPGARTRTYHVGDITRHRVFFLAVFLISGAK